MSSTLDEGVAKRLHELCWQHSRDAIYVADLDSELLLDVNPAAEALSGFSSEELVGRNFTVLHPEDEHSRILNIFHSRSFSGKVLEGFHLLCKDLSIIPVAIAATPFDYDGLHLAMGIYWDVSEQKEREHLLSVQNWALSAYAAAALALGSARSSKGLLQEICTAITREPAFVLAWVGFAEEGPGKLLKMAGAAGPAMGILDGLEVSWSDDRPSGRGPTGAAFRTRTVQFVNDTETDKNFEPWRERTRKWGIRSTLTAPFSVDENRRGGLLVYASHPRAFSPAAITVFANLAEQIGYGLHALDQEQHLHKERRQLERTEKQLVEALSSMVAPIVAATELRDPYTAGHQSRVAELACAIGKEMGWSKSRLQGLRVAALVHDIGKIAIPAEFLTKPTPLTPAERAMIEGHPETAYLILKDIPFPWPVAEIVRQHHENLDGSGYPFGLKGDAILPEARVIAVADIVEAMSTFRPSRLAHDMETVLKEIESKAGKQLDADVVRACAFLFREKGFVLPQLDFH